MPPCNTFQTSSFHSACKDSGCHLLLVLKLDHHHWNERESRWKKFCVFDLSLLGYISDNTLATPNSWKKLSMSRPTLEAAATAVAQSLVYWLQQSWNTKKRGGERKQSTMWPSQTSIFLRSWPQYLTCQAEMNILCQSDQPVVNKRAGAWTLWSLPRRASSPLGLWKPAPGPHPCTHASQTTHTYNQVKVLRGRLVNVRR